jgi:2-(1,2-epoxy-1,2-dihydrophenyl)acetyl-CoA isomerase
MALAKKLASGPTLAYGAVKTLLNETFEHGLEAQMELEARAIANLVVSDDGQEGIAAFFKKRKPEFKGQ